MATTYERLKKIVVEQLGADEDEVKPEASFVDDLNADSLDLVELIMSLEEEFGTEISDEDAEKIRTVQDAVDYIDERVVLDPRRERRPIVRPARAFATRLGLPIRDQGLLEQALVHCQLAARAPRRGARPQRAARVPRRRRRQPGHLRGALRAPSRRRRGRPVARAARRSSRPTGLARLAGRIDLGAVLLLGEGESQRSGRRRPTLLASSFEALTGALYLDLGFERGPRLARRPRRRRSWRRGTPIVAAQEPEESACRNTRNAIPASGPSYRLVDATGPTTRRSFRIEVRVDGERARRRRGPVAARRRDRGRRRGDRATVRLDGAAPTRSANDRVDRTGRLARPRRGCSRSGSRASSRSPSGRTSSSAAGISAVVGPNGSGKSNLADALRWALGEQGRALRSRKSEDVIWAGLGEARRAGHGRRHAGPRQRATACCRSTSRCSSSAGGCTARGENDYLLNKQRIRLRDLVDLLDAAHLADNAFLFIGQGMVDQALALRPEERRPLFEEVAGVRRHERRRRRAEEQLVESEANLARVEDILAELRPAGAPARGAGGAAGDAGRRPPTSSPRRSCSRRARPLARGGGRVG